MTKVKVIRRKKQSALVEWHDGEIRRAFVPFDAVIDGEVDDEQLALAIPYGLPWSQIVDFQASAEALERELHRAGIWTEEDLMKNGQRVLSALMSVYSLDYGALRLATKEYIKGGTE